jgi:hypothetical protein
MRGTTHGFETGQRPLMLEERNVGMIVNRGPIAYEVECPVKLGEILVPPLS